jgi:hypothetical protein
MLGAPRQFILLVLVLSIITPFSDHLNMVESFAGDHRLTRAFRRLGYAAVPYDIVLNPQMDICSAEGWRVLHRPLLDSPFQIPMCQSFEEHVCSSPKL